MQGRRIYTFRAGTDTKMPRDKIYGYHAAKSILVEYEGSPHGLLGSSTLERVGKRYERSQEHNLERNQPICTSEDGSVHCLSSADMFVTAVNSKLTPT